MALLASAFAEFSIESDVPAEKRLQHCSKVTDDAARPDDESPSDADVPDNPMARQFYRCRNKSGINRRHSIPSDA